MCTKNDTIISEVVSLSHDDLVDAYEKLAESYRDIKKENEESKQQLHHNSLQIKTFLSTQNDLHSELETINETHRQELGSLIKKNSLVIENLKEKLQSYEKEKTQLEDELEVAKRKLDDYQRECEELRAKLIEKKPPRVSDNFSDNLVRESQQLMVQLEEMKTKLDEATQRNSSLLQDLKN